MLIVGLLKPTGVPLAALITSLPVSPPPSTLPIWTFLPMPLNPFQVRSSSSLLFFPLKRIVLLTHGYRTRLGSYRRSSRPSSPWKQRKCWRRNWWWWQWQFSYERTNRWYCSRYKSPSLPITFSDHNRSFLLIRRCRCWRVARCPYYCRLLLLDETAR